MLTTSRTTLPDPIATRLKIAAEFVDDLSQFARDNLLGFKRPIATTFALVAPVLFALVYYTFDLPTVSKLALFFCIIAFAGIYLVARISWPTVVEEFQIQSVARRQAIADLRCGFGESSHLNLSQAPRFYEHANGLLVLADAGEWRTIFFSIDSAGEDPRWAFYLNGDLDRRVWKWVRLPVSHEVVAFSSVGTKLPQTEHMRTISSIDAWEAVNLALGEPIDGSVIHLPFDEAVEVAESRL